MAAKALGELPHRELLALRQLDGPLPAALAGIAFGNFRQRPIGVEARGIVAERDRQRGDGVVVVNEAVEPRPLGDRKSTRLNSSHLGISYAVFCLKKKKTTPISV